MIAPNHEASAFASVTMIAAACGMPPGGALLMGGLAAWSGDWPDLDHPGAVATKSLKWVPYRTEVVRNKKGEVQYHRPAKLPKRRPKKLWPRMKWQTHRLARAFGFERSRPKVKIFYFPSWQAHRALCRVSAWIYDLCATEADREDTTASFGPAFRVHRGFSHSIWCALITGALWYAALMLVWPWLPGTRMLTALLDSPHPQLLIAESFAAGMVAHIAGDGCTDFGVSPVAPALKVRGRRYPRLALLPEPFRFKVSHMVEKKIIAPLMVVWVLLALPSAFLGPGAVLDGLWRAGSGVWRALG